VSHGEEVAAVEDAVLEPTRVSPPPPIVIDSTSFQSEQIDKPSTFPVAPSVPPAPTTPPISPSSDKISVGTAIMAQSAEDSTIPWILEDVFFDYDQIEILPDGIPLLEQNAKVLLKRYANREVVIQGHCDERGTEDYNLILGERRARAVKKYLVDLGVAASQLRVLSLGKNKPFCLQHTLACFQQNRRAHFVLN
jgi:peptidoglycan-associated lipoprotein